LNQVTTVVQGAQTRVFKTDSLGRAVYASEPERGVTTYGYAYSATAGLGLTVTRARPQANQTNPAALTTTTTQYDSAGRVVGVGYNDNLTQAKAFAYDAPSGWSSFSQSNLKGRLSEAWTSTPPVLAANSFSYDPMGRVGAMAVCILASGCGGSTPYLQLPYTYDWAGNTLTAGNAVGATTGYAYSAANEVTKITSSLSDATHPGTLLSNVVNGPNGPISWSLGNGLTVFRQFNYRQQPTGQWLCSGVTNEGCVGGTQIYGNYWQQYGSQIQLDVDTDSIQSQEIKYGYDQFNRLASRTVTEGTAQNFAYSYNRYGNRASQTVTAGSGPQPSFNFNAANNHIAGYTYDAAGNMTNDGSHGYTYDAEGNILTVDGGGNGSYAYDALNRRVRVVAGGADTVYLFDAAGRRVAAGNALVAGGTIGGVYYWGGRPIAYYTTSPAATHFEQQDYLGNERLRTSYSGAVEGAFASLPFGDGFASSGADTDPHHFAGLDHDAEDNTEHAQFRNYSSAQGRWLAPDPYDGSYDITNPQSFNRYAYVLNNPLSLTDPSGLDVIQVPCTPAQIAMGITACYATSVVGNSDCFPIIGPQGQYLGTSCTGAGPSYPNNGNGPNTGNPGNTGGGGGGGAPNKPGQNTTTTINNCFSQGQSAASSQPSVAPNGQNVIDTVGGALLGLAAGYFGLPEDAPLLPLISEAASGAAVGFARRSAVHAIQKAFVFDAAYTGCLSAAGIGNVPIG
jgi:RHS repeat-associated protein